MAHHFETTYAMRYAFRTGGLEVRWYSLFVAALFIVGWLISRHLIACYTFGRERRRITPLQIDALYILLVCFGVVGARLGQVLFYEPSMIIRAPLRIFAFREGGMSSHGVFVGLVAAAWLWSRNLRLPVQSAFDIIVASLPVYPFFVRLGNFLNSELYGTPTNAPWGVVFYGAGSAPRHPVQLYEMILEGIVGMILVMLMIKRFGFVRPGLLTGVFLIYYAPIRAFCELLKEAEAGAFDIGFLPTAIVLTVPMFIMGLWLLFSALRSTGVDAASISADPADVLRQSSN